MSIKELTQQSEHDIEVNSKAIEVRITIEVSHDEYFELSDFDAKDQIELSKKIDRGDLVPVVIQVLGHVDGYLFGTDTLGGVLMSSKKDIDDTVSEHSMLKNCLEDTKNNLTEFLKKVS